MRRKMRRSDLESDLTIRDCWPSIPDSTSNIQLRESKHSCTLLLSPKQFEEDVCGRVIILLDSLRESTSYNSRFINGTFGQFNAKQRTGPCSRQDQEVSTEIGSLFKIRVKPIDRYELFKRDWVLVLAPRTAESIFPQQQQQQ
jgi:hypothetical protein